MVVSSVYLPNGNPQPGPKFECAAWERLLAQGWIDATRHLHPKRKVYTYWVNADFFRRNAGFRMDFLLLTPSLAATEVDVEFRGRERASDHAPVWIELA